VGCIGAGAFARGVIFPALRKTRGVALLSVATASGVASESARRLFGFARAVPPSDLLQDAETGAVFVFSRHDSHAQYVIAGLSNHKPVFVEKPLAINREQLDEIRWIYGAEKEKGRAPFLMVGFNRRFAPFSEALQRFFAHRLEPMVVHIRVNAGYIPLDHWSQNNSEGGRIVGELCHFVDWARFVVGSPIVAVSANALPDGTRYNRDNVVATLSFSDGSIANLLYLANGDKSIPKEHLEVFCEGGVACIRDFCTLELTRGGKTQRTKARRDKGHNREIEATVQAMRRGGPSPISFEELAEVSEASIAILEAIAAGESVPLNMTHSTAFKSKPELQQSSTT
jgi:predicted dehydrogenase